MDVGLNVRHQNGASWEDLREGVQLAEAVGFQGVFFPDHFMPTEHIRNADGSHGLAVATTPRGPSDCWTLIAALVPQTSTLHFGTMMTSSTFRHPGPLAVSVAQVNRIGGGGRITMGIGTNWHEPEHLAYGIPFPDQKERFDRLEEQLQIIHGLWNTEPAETFDFRGRYYTLEGAPGIPSPPAGRPRLLIGGWGLKRIPRLAATFCDEVNNPAREPKAAREFLEACDAACEKRGRDPKTLERSIMITGMTVGEDDADIDRQLAAAHVTREQAEGSPIFLPPQLVERLELWQEAGIDRVVLSMRGSIDPSTIRLIGAEVLPKFR